MLSAFQTLTHFALAATLGIKSDEKHVTLTLYTLHTDERVGHTVSPTVQDYIASQWWNLHSHLSSQVPEPMPLAVGTQILGKLNLAESLLALPK